MLLAYDQPMDGCHRIWFACPACRRRCRHVYLPELACRRCASLDYACRHLHRTVPGFHRVMRLRRKLGADPHPFSPLPARRQGRSCAYHEQLVAMIHAAEEERSGICKRSRAIRRPGKLALLPEPLAPVRKNICSACCEIYLANAQGRPDLGDAQESLNSEVGNQECTRLFSFPSVVGVAQYICDSLCHTWECAD